jgi:hypothetical protein
MSNVAINIAAEFTGKKAFKQAETSTDKLTKSVKRLAAGVVLAFGTKQIVAFGKASVKAFAEDEKAAASLGQTLKNLNLAYGSNIGTVNGFISRLELQTGVLDDELRPAMDRLLRATGSVTKAQELLGLALDIAAGTGKSVTQVSQSLQKAYLGQTQALGRLGVGLSKAELESSSFATIQERLNVLFAGQAATAADTYAGSLARLTIAGNNARETIGKGLVDAFVTITNSSSVDDLITKIDAAAESIANFVRETGEFIKITKSIFDFKNLSLTFNDPNAFQGMGNISTSKSSQDTQRADAVAKKNAMAITKLTKEQAANQAKIVKDKKLAAAIDKANLALNKGQEVFDMDKIQIAAALTNQAEQLGKATSSAQVLQIANDTARLNVKRSILALEDAIAAKDEAAIIAATSKLNADLKILNALTGQNTQMLAIETILKGLDPKALIDIDNLKEALRLLGEINLAQTGSKKAPTTLTTKPPTTLATMLQEDLHLSKLAAQSPNNTFTNPTLTNTPFGEGGMFNLEDVARSSLIAGLAGGAGVSGAVSGSRYAAQAANQYNITVQTGIGDPNAIAEAIDQVLIDAVNRGTLRGGYTIA